MQQRAPSSAVLIPVPALPDRMRWTAVCFSAPVGWLSILTVVFATAVIADTAQGQFRGDQTSCTAGTSDSRDWNVELMDLTTKTRALLAGTCLIGLCVLVEACARRFRLWKMVRATEEMVLRAAGAAMAAATTDTACTRWFVLGLALLAGTCLIALCALVEACARRFRLWKMVRATEEMVLRAAGAAMAAATTGAGCIRWFVSGLWFLVRVRVCIGRFLSSIFGGGQRVRLHRRRRLKNPCFGSLSPAARRARGGRRTDTFVRARSPRWLRMDRHESATARAKCDATCCVKSAKSERNPPSPIEFPSGGRDGRRVRRWARGRHMERHISGFKQFGQGPYGNVAVLRRIRREMARTRDAPRRSQNGGARRPQMKQATLPFAPGPSSGNARGVSPPRGATKKLKPSGSRFRHMAPYSNSAGNRCEVPHTINTAAGISRSARFLYNVL